MLAGELLAFGTPVVVALNMVDLAQARGLSLDPEKLGAASRLSCRPRHRASWRWSRKRAGMILGAQSVSGGRGLQQWWRLPLHNPQRTPHSRHGPDSVVEDSVGGSHAVGSGTDTLTERFDKAFTHPVLGIFVFLGVMVGLFWTLFALATIPMELIESDLRVARRTGGPNGCRQVSCTTSLPRASSAASPAPSCFCRRSASCSFSSVCSRTRATSRAPRS